MTLTPKQSCVAGSVFRLYVSGLAVLTWFIGFFEDRSLGYLVGKTQEGNTVLWIMLVGGVVGLLDVLLNDYTTAFNKPSLFEAAKKYRHFGFTVLAFCHACLLLIAVFRIGSVGLALFSLWNAIFIVAFSLVDAHQRYKDAVCKPAFN